MRNICRALAALSILHFLPPVGSASAELMDFEKPEDTQEWVFEGGDGPNDLVEGKGVDGSKALAWSAKSNGPFALAKLTNPTFGHNVDIEFEYSRPFDNFRVILSNGTKSVSFIHADGYWYGDLAGNDNPPWKVDGTFNKVQIKIRRGVASVEVNGVFLCTEKNISEILTDSGNSLSFSIWGGDPTEGYLDNLTIEER